MPQRWLVMNLVLILAGSSHLWGQQKPETPAAPGPQEFPVVLQQNVTAGKTPVGTKIQAKLAIATLLNGTVVPRNASFSGEVVESVAKTATQPSRISLRMDSVSWKKGSAPVQVYVTAWYFPSIAESGQNLQYGPEQSLARTWNGAGAYPDPNSPAYKPFPSADNEKKDSVPDTPNSVTSKRRVPMKDVETERGNAGAVTLVSKRGNLKLDRVTTYVLSSGEMPAAK